MTTTYTLFVEGNATDFSRSTKATVVTEAERTSATDKVAVEVRTQTGTTVFELAAPPARKAYVHPKPDTRVVEVPEGVKVPKGFVAAYDRLSRGALVARNENAEKGSDEKFVVLAIANSEIVGFAATTRGAGQIMLTMPKVTA